MTSWISTWWGALLEPQRAGRLILETPAGFTRRLGLGVAGLYAFYGTSMGMFRGVGPAMVSGVKLPMLYLLTLGVCLLPLYGLNCLMGPRLTLSQCVRLLVLATSANAAALASYVPFSYFFAFTSAAGSYEFLVLTNVGVFAASGAVSLIVIGMIFRGASQALGKRLSPQFLVTWGVLYGFVGTQMSWVLRPWIGAAGAGFSFLRPIEGSFIESVWGLIKSLILSGV